MNSRTTLVLGGALALTCLVSPGASVAQEKFALCKPVETMSFPARVHVRCALPVDGRFMFFAASTQDPRFASRMVNISLVGQVAEKTLSILFDPSDQSGVAFGCLENDCRIVRAIALTESAAPVPSPAPVTPVTPTTPQPPAIQACRAACNVAEGDCMADPRADRQECIAEKMQCVRACGN
jgi:hypothetical protein